MQESINIFPWEPIGFFCFGVLYLFLASIKALTPRKTNKPGSQNKILKVEKSGQRHTEMI